MNKRFFKRWNWEYDYGDGELSEPSKEASSYATAYYDGQGRLYRVETVNRDDSEVVRLTYDYFCDDANRVREKRSLDESASIVVLVRFYYENGKPAPTQVAFYPGTGETRSVVRRDYLARRSAAQGGGPAC